MKDSKELIDLIREGLKNAEELPYKEGAWEAYKAKHEPAGKVRRFGPLWAAAAVAAIAGFILLFKDWQNSNEPHRIVTSDQESVAPFRVPRDEPADKQVEEGRDRLALVTPKNDRVKEKDLVTLDRKAIQMPDMTRLVDLSMLKTEPKVPDLIVFRDDNKSFAATPSDNDLIKGQQIDPHFAYKNEMARQLSPKKLRLTDRFELGAFVSPSTTDRSFDLGGGLVLAYQFNDKLAIRTGASFNQYEVGMLQSHVKEVGEEIKRAEAPIKDADQVISKQASMLRTDNFFVPNLNAVTGKVQTLDIPLEIRYNLTRQLYATGGVSYAAVLSQERYDHYEQSAGIPTYSSASDSDSPTENLVSTVETTRKSDDQNINTNGFGGFVNFSVGRRTNIGKTMKISIEPFVKFPVGQFRRADMNYTNGGIRIMTSF